MGKSYKKYFVNIIMILTFTFVALYFVLKDRFGVVMDILMQVEWYHFVMVMAWSLLVVMVSGKIIQVITKSFGYTYSVGQGMVSALVATFFAGITPSASGGQIGQLYVFKKQGVDYSEGGSILWYEFLIYQLVMIIYVFFLLLLRFKHYYSEFSAFYLLIIIGFIVQVAVIVFLFTMILLPNFYIKVVKIGVAILHRLNIIKQPEKIKEAVELQIYLFKDNVDLFRTKKVLFVKVVLLNILKLTIFYAIPIGVCIALGIELSAMELLDLLALTAFVTMANAFFPVPGASGGTESVFTMVFANLFSMNIASAIMLVWRFATYYLLLIVGGFTFLGFKLIGYKKEEQEQTVLDIEMANITTVSKEE